MNSEKPDTNSTTYSFVRFIQISLVKLFNSLGVEFKDNTYDVITLFHVYEHITDPLNFTKTLNSKLKSNGKIIIEVPHAEDILIKIFNLNSFKKFTFWSEHLILHSKKTLKKFIEHGNFKIIQIHGIQRYNLMNHLYWIFKNKPGGHIRLKKYSFKIINNIYDKILKYLNLTDTLIIVAKKK